MRTNSLAVPGVDDQRGVSALAFGETFFALGAASGDVSSGGFAGGGPSFVRQLHRRGAQCGHDISSGPRPGTVGDRVSDAVAGRHDPPDLFRLAKHVVTTFELCLPSCADSR